MLFHDVEICDVFLFDMVSAGWPKEREEADWEREEEEDPGWETQAS